MHSLLSVHGCSLFSDELLYRLAEKCQPLMNVNIELLHSQKIVAKNMFQYPNSTLKINCLQCNVLHRSTGFVQIGLDSARIASVSAERSFSAMRRIKTHKSHLRASMSETRTGVVSDLCGTWTERKYNEQSFIAWKQLVVSTLTMTKGRHWQELVKLKVCEQNVSYWSLFVKY